MFKMFYNQNFERNVNWARNGLMAHGVRKFIDPNLPVGIGPKISPVYRFIGYQLGDRGV